ncbi:hypothetical protein L2E82_14365 [Cichorium intybus]|uniref:Uncharacterized protein n=1 Tax=Cichorium intybus TaxID=13427 RepID=A0ACB9F0L8_CICIN|nr:hypothetical protein L2E82_14365 [Cichorium intybus]
MYPRRTFLQFKLDSGPHEIEYDEEWLNLELGSAQERFYDFLNDDGFSETDVLGDDFKQVSEVITDKSCAPGDEVLIRNEKFINARLLLDFGFILPSNKYDQVSLESNNQLVFEFT